MQAKLALALLLSSCLAVSTAAAAVDVSSVETRETTELDAREPTPLADPMGEEADVAARELVDGSEDLQEREANRGIMGMVMAIARGRAAASHASHVHPREDEEADFEDIAERDLDATEEFAEEDARDFEDEDEFEAREPEEENFDDMD